MNYETREEYDRTYKDKDNAKIKRILTARNIDIDGIIKQYTSGLSLRNLKILYKLNDEQLSYIFDNYITKKMEKIREKNIKKWENLRFNMDIPADKEDVNELRKRMAEVIDLVEGKEERED